ncbi:hypothetical protein KFE26_18120 [Shewanella sp. M16]|uniref:hypothetical protein n=1 Tax=Shewanella sp. M16 TaxID=2830837 RepID=UPI001BB07AAB|nr:hypothetical protein [Shewanella sp. M16]MBS0044203.1 hypothetical protein [Shewanella sp. M16]
MDDLEKSERAWKLYLKCGSSEEVAKEMGCSVREVFEMIQPAILRMQNEVNTRVESLTQANHLPACIKLDCKGKLHPPKSGDQYFVCDQCQAKFKLKITRTNSHSQLH